MMLRSPCLIGNSGKWCMMISNERHHQQQLVDYACIMARPSYNLSEAVRMRSFRFSDPVTFLTRSHAFSWRHETVTNNDEDNDTSEPETDADSECFGDYSVILPPRAVRLWRLPHPSTTRPLAHSATALLDFLHPPLTTGSSDDDRIRLGGVRRATVAGGCSARSGSVGVCGHAREGQGWHYYPSPTALTPR